MPQPASPASSYALKYDAWNRLVEVKAGSTVVQSNEYDGLNRRIQKVVGTDTYDYYYNYQWQVVEIRKNGDTDPWKQYVYHPDYVDAIAVRYYDENTDGSGIAEHYYLQDANYNVTAITDNAGTVVERYAYTPYGEVTFLDDSFVALSTQESDIDNEYLYTGRRRDPETGLQLNRNRFYAAGLGRWVNRDPIGYVGSQWNLYEYVSGMPTIGLDPPGLTSIMPIPPTGPHPGDPNYPPGGFPWGCSVLGIVWTDVVPSVCWTEGKVPCQKQCSRGCPPDVEYYKVKGTCTLEKCWRCEVSFWTASAHWVYYEGCKFGTCTAKCPGEQSGP